MARNGERILLLAFEAQCERLDPTAHRIAFRGGEHAAESVLRVVHAGCENVVGHRHETGDDV